MYAINELYNYVSSSRLYTRAPHRHWIRTLPLLTMAIARLYQIEVLILRVIYISKLISFIIWLNYYMSLNIQPLFNISM